jgi:hypothetical protein
MPSVFVSGNSGRVSVGGNPVAGLNKWTMTKNTKAVQLLHFESEVDSDGNVWEDQLVGTSSAKVSFEGWIDTNSSTATDSGSPGLRNGLVVDMSLILVKGTPWGFNQVSVQIDQIEISSAIDSDKPATFKGTGVVKGSPGSTTIVTG